MKIANLHTFHIPVMGLAYTIDSPIRVAHLGISSVISVMDDELMERMNKFYSEKFELPYQEISTKMEDFRSRRITAYLNTVDNIVKNKFQELKTSLMENKKAVEDFANTLPNVSQLKDDLQQYLENHLSLDYLQSVLSEYFTPGSIDVNIMTKVDREHYNGKEQLPIQYNDAHAALRGFAQSSLDASVVLSAGMNPRLYAYFEEFDNFFPTENELPQKRIILKVSDYRSALIQGQQLAKKGLWVSEYRIESGLNCGGHAFATDGQLMGHILEVFKEKRQELIETTHQLLCKSLQEKKRFVPTIPLPITITAQGGVGTAQEHKFLLEHYQLDSIGWGSPFLLVPEATSTDIETRNLLANAKEDDLYLSDISPLGVPFNTVRGTTNEDFKQERIIKNNPGSSCPRKYLALDRSFFSDGSCTADRKHQKIALAQLKENEANLTQEEYAEQFQKITEKSCLCIGLANASLLEQSLPIKGQAQGVVICPGPNIAYFTKEASLNEMIDHIYGRDNLIETKNRPNFLIKELEMYVEHYQKEQNNYKKDPTNQRIKKLNKLRDNLLEGIQYYKTLFNTDEQYFVEDKKTIQSQLSTFEKELTSV
ncbi:hypothetical protein [Empedobacter tilapiae]|uniref:Uncharacterized protein n=1 Tax=Empedobacter tilapiae TaxID=2491114 RepID=A0A4Z1BTC7_9FLAO|nr:hypothetical protein [Empedobacter tilapiae]TGN29200.1 hypothetical protein E4J94_04390 [Empedobacter tilapiae]